MSLKDKIQKIIDVINNSDIEEIEVSSFWGAQKIRLSKSSKSREQKPIIVEKPIENKKEEQKNTKIDPKYVGKKMSRNEPCFCGSNKKYKHCCGRF